MQLLPQSMLRPYKRLRGKIIHLGKPLLSILTEAELCLSGHQAVSFRRDTLYQNGERISDLKLIRPKLQSIPAENPKISIKRPQFPE